MMTQTPTSLNLELLIKLLKLTTSPNDGEALSAIRRANVQLSKVGGDWDALLRSRVTLIADPFVDIPVPQQHAWTPPPSAPPAAPRSPQWKPKPNTQWPPPPPPKTTPRRRRAPTGIHATLNDL